MLGRMIERLAAAGGLLLVMQASHAARCYEPSWDFSHAQKISFGNKASYPMEVRPATDAVGDSSLLLIKGSASEYQCVAIGPKVHGVAYPFQKVEHVEVVPIPGVQLVAVAGQARAGGDCCRLLQFLRIAPVTGTIAFNSRGGFALPLISTWRYGISSKGALEVLTAARVLGEDGRLAGAHTFFLERFRYSVTGASFTSVGARQSRAAYDLAGPNPPDIFRAEGFDLD